MMIEWTARRRRALARAPACSLRAPDASPSALADLIRALAVQAAREEFARAREDTRSNKSCDEENHNAA